ncbi:ABC transporter substrate-binding protein [Paracoccus luteus]|uniref:ABC transporter substrate-binding protein n=1 Tax=Paracoccus luteus TaxID=2508543 RepID=UPI001C6FDE2C|nr:ABC transporter substrate-binding protein [Paracoccus luteus]
MSTSWPKTLDVMYGSAEALCARVGELSGGRFEIRAFPAGEIVPPPQNLDAVSNGSVECCHTLASFHIGKDPALAFDAGMAFGLNARQQAAWLHKGGGDELLRNLYGSFGLINFNCGNTGVQMGGWFREEIKSAADVQGLTMRIGGIGGMVLSKLGAVPQQIAAGDIYPSLEKGAIDAAEWIGPHDDYRLGLHRVAPYYYSPGWWEGSAAITCAVGQDAWGRLSPEFQAMFAVACAEQARTMLSDYDALNPIALRKLIAEGAKIAYFPKDLMDAAFQASQQLWTELSDSSPHFAEIYPQWKQFQEEQVAWFRIAENALSGYTSSALNQKS